MKRFPLLTRILIPVLIITVGIVAWKILGIPVEPPKPVRQPPQKLKTERLELTATCYPVILETQGTVRAHHQTTLTSQVSGTIAKLNPNFEDGAFFKAGEILAELDPADLQAARTSAESNLAKAEASLAQEEAKAKQAKLNWDDLGYQEAASPLVLRIPQLKEASANVTAARANLDQANRNLDRTKVRAPFDGRVKSRLIGLGQSIGGTTALGEVFATDIAEVRLPLTPTQLDFIKLPTRENDPAVEVTLTDALGDPAAVGAHQWKARIVRSEGALDESSHELFVIARIEDPFGLKSAKPELRLGQPVRASIAGVLLQDVFVIPRTAMRGLNSIYLIDPRASVIQRTSITPVWSNAREMVVRKGLRTGDWLATTRLPYAPDGAPVEILEPRLAVETPANHQTAKKTSGS